MQKIDFDEALDVIVAQDPRFEKDAYLFVRDALDFTLKGQRRGRSAAALMTPDKHVTGQELLEGVRLFALDQFGPMVPTVFAHWRLRTTEDVGHIVFNLIAAHVFGKTERDTLEDFKDVFDFHEAFVRPFLPPGAVSQPRSVGVSTSSAPANPGHAAVVAP